MSDQRCQHFVRGHVAVAALLLPFLAREPHPHGQWDEQQPVPVAA